MKKNRNLKRKIIDSINKNKKFLLIAAAIIVLSVVIDQVTKAVFHNALTVSETILENGQTSVVSETIPFVGNWLRFCFVINYGASFGMMKGQNGLFFAITVIGLPLFAAFMYLTIKDSKLGAWGIALIIGGVIGNVIDRAFYNTVNGGFFSGGVRDFIDVNTIIIPGGYICNFADVCITVGVALYLIGILFVGQNAVFKKKQKPAEPPKEEDAANG